MFPPPPLPRFKQQNGPFWTLSLIFVATHVALRIRGSSHFWPHIYQFSIDKSGLFAQKNNKQTYVDVLNRVKEASNKAQRNELLGSPGEKAEEDSTEDRYIAEGENILDDNQRILQETLARIGQTREVGMDATDKLQKQNETLMKIGDDLDAMETSLDVSKKVLRQIGVKLATDKYVWILMLLVVVAIVAVFIILKLLVWENSGAHSGGSEGSFQFYGNSKPPSHSFF